MKKTKSIPDSEIIGILDHAFATVFNEDMGNERAIKLFKHYGIKGFNKVFIEWSGDYRIPRRSEMGLFTDFFDWYLTQDSPLAQAMREEDEQN